LCLSFLSRLGPVSQNFFIPDKVIINPKSFQRKDVGDNDMVAAQTKDRVYIQLDKAHLKEWSKLFSQHNVTKRDPMQFQAASQHQGQSYDFQEKHTLEKDDKIVHYDDGLYDWFRSVTGRSALSDMLPE